MIIISLFFPPFWFITIGYFAYLLLTKEIRSEKYLQKAYIWKTGGVFRTGNKDLPKAVYYFTKSSGLGNAEASFVLAQMYAEGDGVSRDTATAEMLFNKSLTQNPEVYHTMRTLHDQEDREAEERVASLFNKINKE